VKRRGRRINVQGVEDAVRNIQLSGRVYVDVGGTGYSVGEHGLLPTRWG